MDLLFFPTGGGKTEAYLGLAAFTLVLRRLRNPGGRRARGAGVSVLMRYTLRLLTLDQLARAAALVCALELERERTRRATGPGRSRSASGSAGRPRPNLMGARATSARTRRATKVRQFKNDEPQALADPARELPWCGTRSSRTRSRSCPNDDQPQDLRIVCMNSSATSPATGRCRSWPSTSRSIAACRLPDRDGRQVRGAALGRADRARSSAAPSGTTRPASTARRNPGRGDRLAAPLPPPDLVIQDELHLISGPLGTMVGLYETALDALCSRDRRARGRPKIVASTATVRRARIRSRRCSPAR